MTDPYASLAAELTAAAERLEARRPGHGAVRTWLSRRINVAAAAAALGLAGGAVAVAATGVLDGAPVKPEVQPAPGAGNGIPVSGGAARLALRVTDPDGGLPWGLRVLHTTRGQVCVQVGLVQGEQLGELGVDSAFGSDGRFHVLPADVLPPGYGGSSSDVECVAPGQTLIFEDANADRSAERLLPEEFTGPPSALPRNVPPTQDLRALAYGLLGPHAVSVTYRTPVGLRTVPVSGPDGVFLILEPAGYIASTSTVGGSTSGEASPASVEVTPPVATPSLISAVTFRFGTYVCSQGSGAPVSRPCPTRRAITPRGWFRPTRSLNAQVGLTLLAQTHAACSAAFLTYPCYKGRVSFTAPYAVTAAGTDYEIEGLAKCSTGGRPETSWSLERDVSVHEAVKTDSLGLFDFTPACATAEAFQVSYINRRGRSAGSPHESVIVGKVTLAQATLPDERLSVGERELRHP